ncbi:MAG: Na+/H+ antiporter NhaC family protein [Acidobacteria bacterium]|nr:Na+/H+ antiporter NhaC family protein [Acidobacteriota bacterium]
MKLRSCLAFLFFLILFAGVFSPPARAADEVYLKGVPAKLNAGSVVSGPKNKVQKAGMVFLETGRGVRQTASGKKRSFLVIHPILSIIPPLVAILFALLFRQVILSLLMGVLLGVWITAGYRVLPAVLNTLSRVIPDSLASHDHISIIIFSVLLGGMVGIISANGGTPAIVDLVLPRIRSRRGAQLACWFLGCAIFFDDYANTLIVGNTMRPITDRYRVSREKLSFFVDATAAPVASMAIISTWIGFEVGVLTDVFHSRGIAMDGYSAFLFSIPYLFYPIFTVIFGFLLSVSGRDFGPMLKAERRAVRYNLLLSENASPAAMETKMGEPSRPALAFIPILAVIFVTLWGILYTGYSGQWALRAIFAKSDSFAALIWGSAAGCFTAAVLSLFARRLTVSGVLDSWLDGIKSMMMAVLILTLAWSLSRVCTDLKTADFILSVVSTRMPMWAIPLLTFLVAAAMSFATGTSWGTMAITYPLLVPVVIGTPYLYPTIAAVLSGAVFGDHCSPISDTTIMSSMASACDHVDHVRTQIPYALTTAAAALVLGYLLLDLRIPAVLIYAIGAAGMWLVLRFVGKKIPDTVPAGGDTKMEMPDTGAAGQG